MRVVQCHDLSVANRLETVSFMPKVFLGKSCVSDTYLLATTANLYNELRSNLVFGPSESSGDQIGLCYLDTVFELYSGYHLGQIIEAA